MSLTIILILLFYFFWGVLSFVAQGESWLKEKLKTIDVLNLIPNYKFFCPRPVCQDYHLYYRRRLPNGNWEDWKEVVIGKRYLWLGLVWNPAKRERKVFCKTVRIIRKHRRDIEGRKNAFYLALVNYVCHSSGSSESDGVQMKITTRQDHYEATKEKIVYERTLSYKQPGRNQADLIPA